MGTNKKIINQIAPCQNYCLFKLFFEIVEYDQRVLVQLKCIEMFKWRESEKDGKDIGHEEAMMRWVTKGYAKKFAEAYSEEKDIKAIYEEIARE